MYLSPLPFYYKQHFTYSTLCLQISSDKYPSFTKLKTKELYISTVLKLREFFPSRYTLIILKPQLMDSGTEQVNKGQW